MPTIDYLKFCDKDLKSELNIFSDSIFYSKRLLNLKDSKFNKDIYSFMILRGMIIVL